MFRQRYRDNAGDAPALFRKRLTSAAWSLGASSTRGPPTEVSIAFATAPVSLEDLRAACDGRRKAKDRSLSYKVSSQRPTGPPRPCAKLPTHLDSKWLECGSYGIRAPEVWSELNPCTTN